MVSSLCEDFSRKHKKVSNSDSYILGCNHITDDYFEPGFNITEEK